MTANPQQWLDQLRLLAQERNCRIPLVLAGASDWHQQILSELALTSAPESQLWSARQSWPVPSHPWSKAHKLLGQTITTLILDISEDIPANALGIASGALAGGGLLIFLAPAGLHWPGGSHFLKRAGNIFTRYSLIWQQGQPLPPVLLTQLPAAGTVQKETDSACRTLDQQTAVTAIERVLYGHRRRPLVLTADRGRGKTAALGIAAARIMQNRAVRILVTAPSRQAVETLFYHATLALPEAQVQKNQLQWQNSELVFVAPDRLCLEKPDAGLLLVDEAAAIPAPLLEAMLTGYSRVVFSSTIHGYEGTGRGFAVRFRKTLDRTTPQWVRCRMRQPIRWCENDPGEALINQLLLLDAEPATKQQVEPATVSTVHFSTMTAEQLANDENLFRELTGLLVLAHYQTSPDDLKQLLDQPEITIGVLRYQQHIVAAAVSLREGGLSIDLAEQVWQQKRRLKGHLLPQTLASHGGHRQAATYRYQRIMRIAVHPDIQQRGLGQCLMQQVMRQAKTSGIDILGSSFGASVELLDFWRKCTLTTVHLGSTRNESSGTHSAVVLSGLSDQGLQFCESLQQRFAELFPVLSTDTLKHLEWPLVLRLINDTPSIKLTPTQQQRLQAFSQGFMNYDAVIPELRLLARTQLPCGRTCLSDSQQQLLVMKLLQNHDWPRVITRCGLTGKKQASQEMIAAVSLLLENLR